MRITKRLQQFIAGYQHPDHDPMLVIETSAPAGWGRMNTLNYCLARPDEVVDYGRVLGTVAEVKAKIGARS